MKRKEPTTVVSIRLTQAEMDRILASIGKRAKKLTADRHRKILAQWCDNKGVGE